MDNVSMLDCCVFVEEVVDESMNNAIDSVYSMGFVFVCDVIVNIYVSCIVCLLMLW